MSATISVVVIADHKRFHGALAEVGEALGHGKGLVNVIGGLAYDPRPPASFAASGAAGSTGPCLSAPHAMWPGTWLARCRR